MKKLFSFKFSDYLCWSFFCAASVIGIWPRFIETKLILTSKLRLKIPKLPSALKGIKILQLSDLHISDKTSPGFLKKLLQKVHYYKPDLILFTGDFLCTAKLSAPKKLSAWLNQMQAPYGCFAILGNHDYAHAVSINETGDYDRITPSSLFLKALKHLGKSVSLTGQVTKKARQIPLHDSLVKLLDKTPFQLLHNRCVTIPIKNSHLNICGLGEYMLGRVDAKKAFQNYDPRFPGIILLHNPDGIPLIKDFPGNLILCGHTHGGQVNLPWLWKKFTLMENMQFKKGLYKVDEKLIYINRGLGSVLPFRFFSPPEILLLTLE